MLSKATLSNRTLWDDGNILHFFITQYYSQKPHVAIEHLKCAKYNWETALYMLFDFNQLIF